MMADLRNVFDILKILMMADLRKVFDILIILMLAHLRKVFDILHKHRQHQYDSRMIKCFEFIKYYLLLLFRFKSGRNTAKHA